MAALVGFVLDTAFVEPRIAGTPVRATSSATMPTCCGTGWTFFPLPDSA